MLRKLTLAFAVAGAILAAPAFNTSQVARADDDDWEDYWEDVEDAREDYYDDLEDYYEDLDKRNRKFLRKHGHYYHNGHVYVRPGHYGYATSPVHPRTYTYYSGRYRVPYHGYVYSAPVYHHPHGTYIQVRPHAGHVRGYYYHGHHFDHDDD